MTADVMRLQRGANVALKTLMPTLGMVVIGFGWKVLDGRGPAVELVPAVLMCGADGKVLSDRHFLFFNQLESPEGSARIVDGGDVDQIELDLREVPASIDRIVLVVYVDPDLRRPGSFASVRDAYFRTSDRGGTELVRYDIEDAAADVNAMIFGEFYRHQGAWKVRAVGQGYSSGLKGVAETFGVDLS